MLEFVEEIRRDILRKLHANIPVPEFMSLRGISGVDTDTLHWEFLPFRLSGRVRERTLLITKIGITMPMLDLFLDEVLLHTPEAELPMSFLAFDVTGTDAKLQLLLSRRNMVRYEIGPSIFYWREVTGQLPLF